MNKFSESLLRRGSLALVLLAPLVFYGRMLFPHVSAKTFFIYGVVEILLFAWIYLLATDASYRFSRKKLLFFLPMFSFVLWMTIAGVWGVNPNQSFWSSFGRGTGLLTLYHCLAFAFIVASLVKKYGETYLLSLAEWFVAGGFILATSVWFGTEGFKLSWGVLYKDAGGGFAGNSTLTAGYLLFAIATAVFLLLSKKLSRLKNIWIVSFIFVTIFSPVFVSLYGVFTGTGALGTARGTMLGLIAGTIATGVGYMFLSNKKSIKGLSVGILALGLLSFGFLWMQLVTPGTYINTKFAEQARNSRFIFWEIAGKAMNEKPFLGYGPENYSVAYQKYFNPQILVSENNFEGWNNRAHNIYYELGSTSGYPGIILFSAFVLSIFYAVYLSYKNNKINRAQAAVFAGLLAAYIVNNLFTFDSNLSLLALSMVAGAFYSLSEQNNATQKSFPEMHDPFYKKLLGVLLLILFVFSFVVFVYRPVSKSKLYTEVFSAAINKRADMYPKLLEGSSVGSDWDTSEMAFSVYKKYASNPAVVKNDPKILPHAIKDISALISYMEKVSEKNKTDYRLYITMNFFQNTLRYLTNSPYDKEASQKTLEVIEKAKNLSPNNPNVYWSLAQVKVWEGDFGAAEDAYRKSIEAAPRLASSYNLFLKYAQLLGNKKLFDEVMILAKENIPGYELKQ